MKWLMLLRYSCARARHDWGVMLLAAFGVGCGTALLCCTLALAQGATAQLQRLLLPSDAPPHVAVVAAQAAGGERDALPGLDFFAPPPLDDEALAQLRALPGVCAAYAKMDLPLPMTASGGAGLLGHALHTDLFVDAVDMDWAHPGLPHTQGSVWPALVHPQLVALYNAGVAPSLHTPSLSPNMLLGLHFDVAIGTSRLAARLPVSHTGQAQAQIIGLSPWAAPLGISIPLALGRTLWAEYAQDSETLPPYRTIWLTTADAAAANKLRAQVQRLGFAVDDSQAHAQQTVFALRAGAQALAALLFFFCSLSAVQTLLAHGRARRGEWTLLRILGTPRRHILMLAASEALLLGLAAAAVGLLAGWGLCLAANQSVVRLAAALQLQAAPLWQLDAATCLQAAAMAVVAAMAGGVTAACGLRRSDIASDWRRSS